MITTQIMNGAMLNRAQVEELRDHHEAEAVRTYARLVIEQWPDGAEKAIWRLGKTVQVFTHVGQRVSTRSLRTEKEPGT